MVSASSLVFSLTAAALFTQSHAFWREACSVVQTGRIDPILAPDGVSGHVHKIAGASSMSARLWLQRQTEAHCLTSSGD